MPFSIVVAADRAGGIGKNGQLPWHLPGDMAYFKRLTLEPPSAGLRNAVIMGRKTWQSIPSKFRPLGGRINVVITSDSTLDLPESVARVDSFAAAIASVMDVNSLGSVFVIGGAQVYRQALEHPDLEFVYLTRVHATFDCDATFGPIPEHFELISRSETQSDGDIVYDFEVYAAPQLAA